MAETHGIEQNTSELGPYTLVESCGAGPRGQVFKAQSNNRFFALKIYHAEIQVRHEDLRSLLRNSGLQHPNILPVDDLGESDGWQYSASRYLHGDALSRVLANLREDSSLPDSLCPIGPAADGAPQPDHIYRCVRMIQQVAEGLQVAHDAGVVHGRISPGNLIFSPSGMLILHDFGGGGHALEGNLYYRAPEELLPESWPAHKGSDIYALGAVLYEMLTLVAPHGNRSAEPQEPGVLREAILAGRPPAPSSIASEIPSSLEACIEKALAFTPENRYPSAAEFSDDLGRFLAGENPHAAVETATFAPPPATAGARWPSRLIAATALLALIVAAAWYSQKAARFEAARLRSLNPPNAGQEALERVLDIVEAQKVGDAAAVEAAMSAAREHLPANERLRKLAENSEATEK